MKFDFSRHICAADQSLVRGPPPDGAPPFCDLTYLSTSPTARATITCDLRHSLLLLPRYIIYYYLINYYYYFDKLLRLENIELFSRQDKILFILNTRILILYRKLYINIVSIIVWNFEARQYNIKIKLAVPCRPSFV